MGQRLNIEIWEGNECLANAYFHWDAYTHVAIQHVKSILRWYEENNVEGNQVYAVRMLCYSTSAGLPEEDGRELINLYGREYFTPCTGRNDGIISVSKSSIERNRDQEEHRVSIYLDQERINFGVFRSIDKYQWANKCKECELTNELWDYQALPIIPFDATNIYFGDFDKFAGYFEKQNIYYSQIMQKVLWSIK